MEKQQYRFKTNIHCGGCVNAVKPRMDALKGVEKWTVDIDTTDKILQVESSGVRPEEIIAAVQSAGFTIEPETP